MKINFHIVELKMRHTFTIAHGSRDDIEGFIVEIEDGQYKGYGEATPIPYYGVTAQAMKAKLESVQDLIINNLHLHPIDFWAFIHPHLQDNSFAHCALDMAVWDLYGKRQHQPLYKIWGLNRRQKLPLSNYTIGIDSIEKMLAKMQEIPFPIYKIKLGTNQDIAIVEALRKHTNALFRVDANCAWTVEETIENAKKLAHLGVEFIEQPLQADDYEGMKEVMKHSVLPVMADESCIVEADVAKCIGRFHAINIKLSKCGGLTPALRMIQEAKKANLKVMVGCMTETSVGISGIGQLLPLLDYVDMDGSILIANDPAEGVYLDFGKAIFPKRNGTGARWKIQ